MCSTRDCPFNLPIFCIGVKLLHVVARENCIGAYTIIFICQITVFRLAICVGVASVVVCNRTLAAIPVALLPARCKAAVDANFVVSLGAMKMIDISIKPGLCYLDGTLKVEGRLQQSWH